MDDQNTPPPPTFALSPPLLPPTRTERGRAGGRSTLHRRVAHQAAMAQRRARPGMAAEKPCVEFKGWHLFPPQLCAPGGLLAQLSCCVLCASTSRVCAYVTKTRRFRISCSWRLPLLLAVHTTHGTIIRVPRICAHVHKGGQVTSSSHAYGHPCAAHTAQRTSGDGARAGLDHPGGVKGQQGRQGQNVCRPATNLYGLPVWAP